MGRTKADALQESAGKGKAAQPRGIKAKPANKVAQGASFVVSSLQEWASDGFHSYEGPGDRKTDSVHKTLKSANKRAQELFYKENPWGLEVSEVEDMDVDETVDRLGCLTLTVHPPDSEMWKVEVEMVAAKKK